jgi:hypothetical protein
MCIHRFENHVYLPNIVGPWLPHRDCDEDSKPYYFAAMLAFLKPWRDLDNLKDHDESWEEIFGSFISNASQQDRDVIAGSQYYYESKNVLANRTYEDEPRNVEEDNNKNEEERRDETELENEDNLLFISRSFINSSFPLSQLFFKKII